LLKAQRKPLLTREMVLRYLHDGADLVVELGAPPAASELGDRL
jgi:hypothetical protein